MGKEVGARKEVGEGVATEVVLEVEAGALSMEDLIRSNNLIKMFTHPGLQSKARKDRLSLLRARKQFLAMMKIIHLMNQPQKRHLYLIKTFILLGQQNRIRKRRLNLLKAKRPFLAMIKFLRPDSCDIFLIVDNFIYFP